MDKTKLNKIRHDAGRLATAIKLLTQEIDTLLYDVEENNKED